MDLKLLNEAYYAFENAVFIYEKTNNRIPNLNITKEYALKKFISNATRKINIKDYTTEHCFNIFHILKDQNIWNGTQLKNQSELTNCIGSAIANEEIKTLFNTLTEVESLESKLIANALSGFSTKEVIKDKSLMTYVALDLFYAKFFNVDFSDVRFLTTIGSNNHKQ